jgi:hypothetical protein
MGIDTIWYLDFTDYDKSTESDNGRPRDVVAKKLENALDHPFWQQFKISEFE